MRDLERIQRRVGGKAKVMLFGEFSGRQRPEEINDPYYGARDGFDVAYEQCVRFSRNFLKQASRMPSDAIQSTSALCGADEEPVE